MSPTAMDALAIADFLEPRYVGVLSLSDGGDAYAIPVSYAFDEDGPALYFRLGYAPASQKADFVAATDHAAFVVYDQTDAGWRSVVAVGPLTTVSRSSLDSTVAEALAGLDIPYFSVHDRSRGDLEFHLVRLRAETLSGIVEG